MKRRGILTAVCICLIGACTFAQQTGTGGTYEEFIADAAKTSAARSELGAAQLTKLGQEAAPEQIMELCTSLASQELEALQGYDYETDSDQDDKYIREGYLKGLHIQAECTPEDEEAFWKEWQRGYLYRLTAVGELEALGLAGDFGDALKADAAELIGTPNEAQSDNIYFIQAVLETSFNGEYSGIDGKCGNSTKRYLRRFQKERIEELEKDGSKVMFAPCAVINESLIVRMIENGILTKEVFDGAVQYLEENGAKLPGTFVYESFAPKADTAADAGEEELTEEQTDLQAEDENRPAQTESEPETLEAQSEPDM